jgi:hypothetical protein
MGVEVAESLGTAVQGFVDSIVAVAPADARPIVSMLGTDLASLLALQPSVSGVTRLGVSVWGTTTTDKLQVGAICGYRGQPCLRWCSVMLSCPLRYPGVLLVANIFLA